MGLLLWGHPFPSPLAWVGTRYSALSPTHYHEKLSLAVCVNKPHGTYSHTYTCMPAPTCSPLPWLYIALWGPQEEMARCECLSWEEGSASPPFGVGPLIRSGSDDLGKCWEVDGNRFSAVYTSALKLGKLLKTGKVTEYPLLPVWPTSAPRVHANAQHVEGVWDWWISRFFLLCPHVECQDIYGHVGTGVW